MHKPSLKDLMIDCEQNIRYHYERKYAMAFSSVSLLHCSFFFHDTCSSDPDLSKTFDFYEKQVELSQKAVSFN